MTQADDYAGRESMPGEEQPGGAPPGEAGTTDPVEAEVQASAREAGEAAERIAAEGEDVREQVRRLMTETVQQRRLRLDQIETVAQRVLSGAAAGVRETTHATQDSVLRSVVDGIADGYAAAADATRQAIDDATRRGKTFAREDLKRAYDDLRELDRRFFRIIRDTTGHGWGTLTDQARAVNDQARTAGRSIRPAVEGALRAIREHPVQFGSEAAAAGVEATRQTAGRLLQVAAGLLQGAGDTLASPRRPRDPSQQ